MTALVQVLSPSDYQAKIQQLSRQIQAANAQVTQLRQLLVNSGSLQSTASGSGSGATGST
jgi:outer membrane murein-binding lipoprotein Lpp